MGQPSKAQELFQRLLDEFPSEHWPQAIGQLAGGDPDLEAELQALVAAYESAQKHGFLETPAKELLEPAEAPARQVAPPSRSKPTTEPASKPEQAPAPQDPAPSASKPTTELPSEPEETPGQQVLPPSAPAAQETLDRALDDTRVEALGPYKIRRLLGSGAFSSVYLAEQKEPVHRTVAVKVFRWPGDAATQGLAARFLQEQEVLALLDHPNIARIYDGGVLPDGRPFYVMELVRAGKPLTRFCDDLGLGIQDRLALFLELCSAIQHAHQKGIIHRDLKPANVLAYEEDGQRRVKVIDFGLAKALQRRLGPQTVETTLGAFFGTPAYMPPEQAGGDPLRIDTRADIYSLGAILYELLTGRTPLELSEASGDLVAQVELIRHREPIRPSQRVRQDPQASLHAQRRGTSPSALAHALEGDLDWIVLRCLEKEPGRRYPTVSALMEDIGRYLRHEPVSAAPPSLGYRMRKFVRRHRGILAAVGAVAAALVIGLVGVTLALLEANRQRAEAERQQAIAESQRAEAERQRSAAELAAQEAQRQRTIAEAQRVEAERQRLAAEAQRQKAEQAAQAERLACLEAETQKLQAQKAQHLAEQRLSHLQKSLRVLTSVLTRLNPRAEEKGVVSLGRQLAEAVEWAGEQLEKVSGEDPHTVSQLQVMLGNLLLELGELQKAIQILEKALSLREQHLGQKHPETLKAMHLLAKAYHTLGDLSEAIVLYEKLRDAYQNPRGLSEERIVAFHDLAVGYQDVGRVPEAIVLYHQIHQDFLQTFGENSSRTLTALNNQAIAYLEAGLVSEATALLERVCKLRDENLGPEHPDTLTPLVSLAMAYQEMGQLSEAMELLQKVAAIQQKNLGLTHPDTLATLDNLAIGYLVQGNLSEAIRRLSQVRDAKISCFGAFQPETLGTLHNLAVAYRELGQLQEALALLNQVCQESVRENGPEHPDTLLALYNLSVAYMKMGETEKAISACEQSALGMEKIGFLHRSAWVILQTLIQWYEERAETSQAEKWRLKWLVSTGEVLPSPEKEIFSKQLAIWRSHWGLEIIGPCKIEELSAQ